MADRILQRVTVRLWKTCGQVYQRKLSVGSSRAVKLAYTSLEATAPGSPATPIVIQHGLLGSRKNWATLGKRIHQKTGRKVIIPDARNHGNSPHSDELNYQVLAEDIVQLLEDLKIPRATMIGHSMGGRAMMTIALTQPSLIDRLVVVDVSPVGRSPGADVMQRILETMQEINLGNLENKRATARKIADEHLQSTVKETVLRQFLLTNLVEDEGKFRWRINLKAIVNNLENIVDYDPPLSTYNGPTLFLGGGKSDYIRPSDHGLIRNYFPQAEFQYVPDAGHWVHSEKPAEFLEKLLNFLVAK